MSKHPIDCLCDEMGLLERLKQVRAAYQFELRLDKQLSGNVPEYPGLGEEWAEDIAHIEGAIAQLEACQQSVIEQWAASDDERYRMYAEAVDDYSVLQF